MENDRNDTFIMYKKLYINHPDLHLQLDIYMCNTDWCSISGWTDP